MIELSEDAVCPAAHVAQTTRTPEAIASGPPWRGAAYTHSFRELIGAKRRLVVPLLGGSLAFILAVTLLAGYGRELMGWKVLGPLNVGYVLILLIYALCWLVATVYVNTANRRFEELADRAAAEAHARSQS
ncbi:MULTISPECIES: DUF485 domain-containing protein [Pseudomonadota]|jgi:uncharacterized membrane protein (DUF485 family)|uniref:DUF485 domain-containing protein n=3 Tax=Burkholderiaceae TaxID=119060 RepID=J9S234_BURCE|nr:MULTISPECIES: DUF485 domain-containing protein [Pseudomonadota]AFR44256.1 hypothetical protein pYS10064 [Burkholderia cepacia]AMR78533.1 hypothetical protein A2G96_12730 [Cupriavidus nantongensis]MBU9145457.1 DUF485 domain-containing protein [Burkholderia multivorans]MWL55282.1 DUF485 domain-containing protein [Escherichia coli]NPT51911.1 DUF485 domain-containing protein [Ralstonia sp. 3N]